MPAVLLAYTLASSCFGFGFSPMNLDKNFIIAPITKQIVFILIRSGGNTNIDIPTLSKMAGIPIIRPLKVAATKPISPIICQNLGVLLLKNWLIPMIVFMLFIFKR